MKHKATVLRCCQKQRDQKTLLNPYKQKHNLNFEQKRIIRLQRYYYTILRIDWALKVNIILNKIYTEFLYKSINSKPNIYSFKSVSLEKDQF